MEDRRFDDLSRIAARSSRRQAFKALGGGAAGGLLAMLGVRRATVEAAGVDCCPQGHPTLCGLTCVDTSSDPTHCGACGNTCKGNETCSGGQCLKSVKCPKGTIDCGGACVDLSTDVNNCGGCGTKCLFPNAQEACSGGSCVMSSCDAGFANCDGDLTNGCETDLTSDVNHCGGCGVVCASGQTCVSGACSGPAGECTPGATQPCYSGPAGTAGIGICAYGTQTCASDATWGACVGEVLPSTETCNNLDDDCDGVVDNGFDKQHDTSNCGSCGNVCQFRNATAGCFNGVCGIAACDAGFSDCDGDPANGCEINTTSDPKNCGRCGTVCASGICQNGNCVAA